MQRGLLKGSPVELEAATVLDFASVLKAGEPGNFVNFFFLKFFLIFFLNYFLN